MQSRVLRLPSKHASQLRVNMRQIALLKVYNEQYLYHKYHIRLVYNARKNVNATAQKKVIDHMLEYLLMPIVSPGI